MPTNMKDDIRPCEGRQEYTSTYATSNPEIGNGWSIWKKLRFYHAMIKWLWAHRKEPNNRHKWRRMMREVQE